MPALALPGRILLFFAGLIGASGVALAAAAYHGSNPMLQSAALICLAHGPALIGLAILSGRIKAALAAGIVMIFGTALFAGDIIAKTYAGTSLFFLAAPIGGSSVILSWVLVAVAALIPARGGA
ncbi:DUF423 domain-containing protein [Martelella alba]|uniref:DUF423 domain-containing protein n=1 Tax=Martelella alba TaxID=2590451 RepID=A0A506U8I3_9HYPH|nr:DUF423 domain-containing protein [Martelella alba]TPW28869.1 DUF423 domain-containing protein [Martelella alba]